MAFKLVEQKWCEEQGCPIQSYIVDSADDIAALPSCCAGSTAEVAGGSTYIANASGEWVERGAGGSGGSSGGGSGGGSGECDWNTMKNKPFGTRRSWSFEGEPQTFTFTTDANGYAEIDNTILNEADRYYLIEVDGVSYSGICVDAIGNDEKIPVEYHNEGVMQAKFVEFADDNGNPFAVIYSGMGAGYYSFTEFHNFPANSEITVLFGVEEEYIDTIDPKFLPESIVSTEKPVYGILMKNDNDVEYMVSISENGELVVQEW